MFIEKGSTEHSFVSMVMTVPKMLAPGIGMPGRSQSQEPGIPDYLCQVSW